MLAATDPTVLDGHRLAAALRAGIARVLARQDHLNRINVFPVPDGDTGTNLALTVSAVLAVLDDSPTAHAGELLTRVADAALDGARGNSGALLAQYLLGLGDRLAPRGVLSAADLGEGFVAGARYAREALAEPREGTILSVFAAVAEEVTRLTATGAVTGLLPLLEPLQLRAQSALEATRTQLESLRRADVVDAGAMGFVELLSGFTAWLATGEMPPLPAAMRTPEVLQHDPANETDWEHRWCTECVVTAASIDRRQLREQLAVLGSSLVLAGSSGRAKIHVHTAAPDTVFRVAATHGQVSGQKADDMRRQSTTAQMAERARVVIATDSAADIPESELERLDIHVVPARVHFGEHSYLDKVSLSPDEFYALLASSKEPPKTSQPPPGDFRRLFEHLASHHEAVVSVNLTRRASGTLAAAEQAAARLEARDRVRVIDSGNVSTGQGLIAMHAAECAQAGASATEIVAAVHAARAHTQTYACLTTLEHAVRGGRVPAIAGTLARWLHVMPLLAALPNGRVGFGGVLAGHRDLTRKFAHFLRRRIDRRKRYRVLIGHGHAPAEGQRLLDLLTTGRDNIDASWLIPAGTALGVHGGPGMLVVALQEVLPVRSRPS
jgi:DegV family protein with EDD domain